MLSAQFNTQMEILIPVPIEYTDGDFNTLKPIIYIITSEKELLKNFSLIKQLIAFFWGIVIFQEQQPIIFIKKI